MTSGGLLKQMVGACVVLALAAAAIGIIAGYPLTGLGLSTGLLLGALNGRLMLNLMRRRTPFVLSGLVRIGFFSALVLIAALTLRSAAWTLALGIGLAQLVLVGLSIRQGLRA